MRMTDAQAISYCKNHAEGALDGTPSGEEKSRIWHQLREELEQKGLDVVEQTTTRWRDEHTGVTTHRVNMTWILYGTFLDAIEDDDIIQRAIARELLVRVQAEAMSKSSLPLRTLYLSYLREHLNNVIDGAAELEDYQDVRKNMEYDIEQLEKDYGSWIRSALDAQN